MNILFKSKLANYAALGCVLLSFVIYLTNGYNSIFLLLWLLGLVLFGFYFWEKRKTRDKLEPIMDRSDIWLLLLISLCAAAIYLPYIYDLPLQGNPDEITILEQIRQMLADPQLNPLGPSTYKSFPALVHLIFGWTAKALGGVSFGNLRTVDAFCGISCVVISYIFFRTLGMQKLLATSATTLVGLNHSLVILSRIVSRNNTALLLEVAALSLLFRGFKKECPFLLYLGGIIAGLSFYTYTPARTIIFNFLLAVMLISYFSKNKRPAASYFKLLRPSLLAFIITIVPMVWATITAPYCNYPMDQFLFTKGGRLQQQDTQFAKSELEGILINIDHGLRAFNWPIPDAQGTYWHPGFAFVDVVTGLMIWVGLIGITLNWRKRSNIMDADLLCTSGFISLYLTYAFVVNYAPNYTRLLTTLPFVSYLATNGMMFAANALRKAVTVITTKQLALLTPASFIAMVIAAASLNLYTLFDYVEQGIMFGDIVTPTYRLIDKECSDPRKKFVLAADQKYQYYIWRVPSYWKEWLGGDSMPDRVKVITSTQLQHALQLTLKKREVELAPAPFRLFLNNQLWLTVQSSFKEKYPNAAITEIVPSGKVLSVDVSEK